MYFVETFSIMNIADDVTNILKLWNWLLVILNLKIHTTLFWNSKVLKEYYMIVNDIPIDLDITKQQ